MMAPNQVSSDPLLPPLNQPAEIVQVAVYSQIKFMYFAEKDKMVIVLIQSNALIRMLYNQIALLLGKSYNLQMEVFYLAYIL